MKKLLFLFILLFAASCSTIPNVPPTTQPEVLSTSTISPTLPAPVIVTGSTATPIPTQTPLPTNTPEPTMLPSAIKPSAFDALNIERIGNGQIPLMFFATDSGANELLNQFASSLDPSQSLLSDYVIWLMPTQADELWLSNADTRYDGCVESDWSPETSSYPFSDPISQQVHPIVSRAWLLVEVRTSDDVILEGSCNFNSSSSRFAATLSGATGLSAVSRWQETGSWVDYATDQGITALTLSTSTNNPQLLSTVVENFSTVAESEVWISADSHATWQFPQNSLIHPLAIDVFGDTAYLIDSGRVLSISLTNGTSEQILTAETFIEGVKVLEPLDLTVNESELLVLDRVGDVYRYNLASRTWSIDRYDRPVRDISAHYYFALSEIEGARYLLENSYDFVTGYTDGTLPGWLLPESFRIDLDATGRGVYVLLQNEFGTTGQLKLYTDTVENLRFSPQQARITDPRQVIATDSAVFVLDQAGYRILKLNPDSGNLLTTYRLTNRQPISAIWSDGDRLILSTKDWLYGVNMPQDNMLGQIESSLQFSDGMPNDLTVLNNLRGLKLPIGIQLSPRDFQMPGAPRHYRYGIHEGADLYWAVNSPIVATASGTVIRAMHDYKPDIERFDLLIEELREVGYTPEAVADFYRGRQVWLEADNGLITRYAHMSEIDDAIQEGARVEKGQLVGYIGNSGSPSSRNNDVDDAHIHFELWTQNGYIGQFLRPIETRYWLRRILN